MLATDNAKNYATLIFQNDLCKSQLISRNIIYHSSEKKKYMLDEMTNGKMLQKFVIFFGMPKFKFYLK